MLKRSLFLSLSLLSTQLFASESKSNPLALEFLGDLVRDDEEAKVLIVGSTNAPRAKNDALKKLHGTNEKLDYTGSLPWQRKTWTNDLWPSKKRSKRHLFGDIATINPKHRFGAIYVEMLPSLFIEDGVGDRLGAFKSKEGEEKSFPIEAGLKNMGKLLESKGKLIIEHIPMVTFTNEKNKEIHPTHISLDRSFQRAWLAYTKSTLSKDLSGVDTETLKWLGLIESWQAPAHLGEKRMLVTRPHVLSKKNPKLFLDVDTFLAEYSSNANFTLWLSAVFTQYYWDEWQALLEEAGFHNAEFFVLKEENPINNRAWCLYITAIKN